MKPTEVQCRNETQFNVTICVKCHVFTPSSQSYFHSALVKCHLVTIFFVNFFQERYLKFYIFYCQNKPKSMNLVHEFKDTYFAVSS